MVSIIVPVYNADKYLRRCVDSILSQTYTDWECILVDDGSPDKSGAICDEYAEKDSRIKVIHKENGGVSSARNAALEIARGDWVAFVDSDDLIDKNYLDFDNVPLNCDVIYKSYSKEKNGNVVKKRQIKRDNYIKSAEEVRVDYIKNRVNALWNKIIKRSVIGNIRFYEDVKVGEDMLFFLNCLCRIRGAFYSNKGIYRYMIYDNSTMGGISQLSKTRFDIVLANILLSRHICKNGNIREVGDSIFLETYIPYLCSMKQFIDADNRKIITDYLKEVDYSVIKQFHFIKIIRIVFSIVKLKLYLHE